MVVVASCSATLSVLTSSPVAKPFQLKHGLLKAIVTFAPSVTLKKALAKSVAPPFLKVKVNDFFIPAKMSRVVVTT